MKIIRFNNPFRGYIRPTDYYTQKQVPIYAKRIVNVTQDKENPAQTIIDCGSSVGFEKYTVKEPVHTIHSMIQKAYKE